MRCYVAAALTGLRTGERSQFIGQAVSAPERAATRGRGKRRWMVQGRGVWSHTDTARSRLGCGEREPPPSGLVGPRGASRARDPEAVPVAADCCVLEDSCMPARPGFQVFANLAIAPRQPRCHSPESAVSHQPLEHGAPAAIRHRERHRWRRHRSRVELGRMSYPERARYFMQAVEAAGGAISTYALASASSTEGALRMVKVAGRPRATGVVASYPAIPSEQEEPRRRCAASSGHMTTPWTWTAYGSRSPTSA